MTVVTYSRMVHRSLKAAEKLAEEGVSVEVIDLRSLADKGWLTANDLPSEISTDGAHVDYEKVIEDKWPLLARAASPGSGGRVGPGRFSARGHRVS